jgi:hypothetical protein
VTRPDPKTTLQSLPGILDPNQNGYHDSDQPDLAGDRATPESHGCGSLPERAILAKSPNHPASAAHRLVIEAAYPL